MNHFAKLLGGQLAGDVRAAPARLRATGTDAARVARCRTVADLRAAARRRVPRVVFDYVDGAANDEVTLRRNRADLERLELRPRVLVDVTGVDTRTSVLGGDVALPLVGAPTGLTGLVHHRGELAIARAVHAAGSPYTLSVMGSYSIEELARAAPGPTWLGLYMFRDRGLVADLIARARASGFAGLMLTVDVPRAGTRERDVRNGFGIPPRVTLRTLASGGARPAWSAGFLRRPRLTPASMAGAADGAPGTSGLAGWVDRQFDPSTTWADLEWVRDAWAGPLAVKGILRADDARRAVDLGASAIAVGNHGGRQLDGAASAVAALPAVLDAVAGDAEVYLDGGVRRGTDVLKALALGARACLIGRALVYGLGAGGEAGARRALAILERELTIAMALAGCPSVAAVDRSLLA